VASAALGGSCSNINDCSGVAQSSCIANICVCNAGFITGGGGTTCVLGGGGTTVNGSASNNVGWGNVSPDTISNITGLGATDPREIAANVINVILGFLGIIAVVLILVGGFMWMTAAGNDDKVATAKKIMTAGIIGLVIVLAAFGIAKFVINALITATV
ncbi:MAG: pilin, partial [Patescibacteria group bacterium]